MTNYYKELGVNSNATKQEIKLAYLTLLKKYHPDVYEGDPKVAQDKTALLNECYDVLKDDEKRAQYDQKLFANTQKTNQKTPDDYVLREFFKRFKMNNINTSANNQKSVNQNKSKKEKPKKEKVEKEPQKEDILTELERRENRKLTIYICIILVIITAIIVCCFAM